MAGQFVFIDVRVDAIDTLLGGLVPGAQVRLLDPTHDGLAQVAETLQATGASGLSAISIVAHGAPGRLEIGPDGLTGSDLPTHASSLQAIAAALGPDGGLRLYACDVATGEQGRRFVADLAGWLGGARVLAASHAVGSDREGGSWSLDVATRPVDAPPAFTVAARDVYPAILAIKFTNESDPFGQFGSPQGSGENRLLFGDFDNDGDVDVVFQSGNTVGTGFGYFKNDGNGTYIKYSNIETNAAGTPFVGFSFAGIVFSPNQMFVIDADGDGDLDILDRNLSPGGGDTTMSLWRNDNGTFTNQADPLGSIGAPAGSGEARMIFGDFDKDGDTDVVFQVNSTVGAGFGYFKNNGGTFVKYSNIETNAAGTPFVGFNFAGQGFAPANMFVVDIDGDGDLDILDRNLSPSGGDNATTLWRNDNGTFTNQADPLGLINGGSGETRMAFGDFDSDGDVDVVFQAGTTTGSGYGYFKNNGSGSFTKYTNIETNAAGTPFVGFNFAGQGFTAGNIFVFDVDNDGDVDIVDRALSPSGGDTTTTIWEQGGDGDGSPPTLVSSSPADNATGVAPGANIVVTFDESVTKGTGNIEIVRISNGAVVESIAVGSANVTGSGTTWTINPTNNLLDGVEYGVRIAQGTFVDSDGAIYFGNPASAISFTVQANVVPTATNLTQTVTYTEDAPSVALGDIVVTDTDPGETITARLTLNNTAAGTLTTSGAATYNAGTGVWTITGSVTAVNTALANVSFTPAANFDQDVTITTQIRDAANTGPANGTITLDVTPVNDPPTLSATGTNPTYTEGGAAADLFSNVSVSTIESGQIISGAVLTVSNVSADGSDHLIFAGLDVVLNAASTTAGAAGIFEVRTVNGTATVTFRPSQGGQYTEAQFRDLIDGLTYYSASQNPSAGPHVITLTSLTDNGGGQNTTNLSISSTVTVAPDNDAPTVTAPLSVSVTEDVASAITGISFADADAGGASVIATFSVLAGTLAATSGGNVTVGGSATALTLTGSIANINTFIAGSNLTYQTAQDATAPVTLGISINDGGNTGGPAQTGSGSTTINVAGVNDGPSIMAPPSVSVTEDVASALTGISFADVDAATGSVFATFTVAAGALAATSGGGVTVSGDALELTLTGSIANINTFIAGNNLTYQTAQDATGDVDLAIAIDDNGNSGSGSPGFASTFTTLDVTAVNDAPTAINLTQMLNLAEDAAALALFTIAPTVADIDSTSLTATLTLADPAAGVLTGSDLIDLGGGVYTITGTAEFVQSALAAVQFDSADNYNGMTNVVVAISDGNPPGTSGTQPEGTVAITVSAVDDPATDFTLSASTVAENSANGTVVGLLNAVDPDGGAPIFSLVPGQDAGGRFTIVGNELRVADGLLLDFEQQTSHAIRVHFEDNGVTVDRDYLITVSNVDPDVVQGDGRANTIFGGALADRLFGGAGNDILNGGDGNDLLRGEGGGDQLIGGLGDNDTADYSTSLLGVSVDLVLTQFNSNDALGDTYSSIENIVGTDFNDVLRGDGNANIILGGAGANLLYGRGGNDTLEGGAVRDELEGGVGADAHFGGGDFDYVTYLYASSGVLADLQYTHVNTSEAQGDSYDLTEGIRGSNFNDNLRGDTGNNWLVGGAGDDYFYGRAGTDYLYGGAGNDTFHFQKNYQYDIIQDFKQLGADRIEFQASGANGFGPAYDTFAELIALATQSGTDTVFNFDAQTRLVLANTTVASLTSADFQFI